MEDLDSYKLNEPKNIVEVVNTYINIRKFSLYLKVFGLHILPPSMKLFSVGFV